MTDQINAALRGQLEAALAMMHECVQKCPAAHWEGTIGRYPFWQVAYHTLCFLDLYLSPSKEAFSLRAVHPAGWAEFDDEFPSRRFEQEELLGYIEVCRRKIGETLGAETREVLDGPSGFPRQPFSRMEMHMYNMRHVQHHAGQLSAYLRRAGVDTRWAKSGWPESR